MSPVIAGRKQVIVPILRAGLGMTDGLLKLLPTAKVGHIGMVRDEETHPDVQIYVGHTDRQLNDNAYILPGLGDAGDRIFGTV